MVQTSSLKYLQKSEKWPFQTLRTFVFEIKIAPKPFSRKSIKPKSDLNSFERFASLSQKMISTSSLRYFQKTEEYPCEALITFVLKHKVSSRPFYKKLCMTKFWFKQCTRLCLTFPENGFNFVTQIFAKIWKILFLNTLNILFWAQGCFKTIS